MRPETQYMVKDGKLFCPQLDSGKSMKGPALLVKMILFWKKRMGAICKP